MRKGHRGVTLIEMVVAITVVAIAATTILGALGAVASRSADAMMQQQAIAVAGSYLDEIMQRWVVDPSGSAPNTGRGSWDLVDEYNGLVDAGAHDQFGNPIAGLGAYTVSVVTSKVLSVTVGTTGPGGTTTLPLAYSEVRESDSVVTAQSGQLIVIGGLMQKSHSYQDYRVPVLGDIPLLGNLFKSQQKIENHTELVILLRPIIVDSDAQWSQLTGQEVDHAAALDPKVRSGAQ